MVDNWSTSQVREAAVKRVGIGVPVTEQDVSNVAWLARICSETERVLEVYQARVNEGKDLMAALEFARHVLWSGLVPLCKSNSQEIPRIDGALLQWKAEELQRSVQGRFVAKGGTIALEETQLEAINRKLDLIAGRLSHVQPQSGGKMVERGKVTTA